MPHDFRTLLRRTLITVGVGLLAICGFMILEARHFESRFAERLAGLSDGRDARGWRDSARATRREAGASGLVGRIEVPRLGISAIVAEGTTPSVLRRAVGHVSRTAFPGEGGNVGIAGHRDTHFRNLKDVAGGDRIVLETPDGRFEYRVDSILVVRPDRGDLLNDTGDPRLTLVTCYPFHWVGPAPKRFVVQASPVESGAGRSAIIVAPAAGK